MSLVRALAAAPALLRPAPSFRVCRSQALPAYCQLSLTDAHGCLAHWVLPLKHLAKQAKLPWQLLPASSRALLTCLDAGPVCLRTNLAEGVLRLYFGGQLLHGYFRLHCLPGGAGHLWQLIPIGQA